MTDQPETEASANPDYAMAQLARALLRGGSRAAERAEQWRRVVQGMLDGSLRIGDRAPMGYIPPWVTPEVVHGGFATGSLAAGGPLQPHERAKILVLGAQGRLELNLYYAGESGRQELSAWLQDGRYRVNFPEEGALLIAGWLARKGEQERAESLLGLLAPHFESLRFYPVPAAQPPGRRVGVYRWTVGESIGALRAQRSQQELERMTEAVRIWAPMYDRTVALFLETVDGPLPRRDQAGRVDPQSGWPCRRFPNDWAQRARALLREYRQARESHRLCGKPERKKENFYRLRAYLAACLSDPVGVGDSEAGRIRSILAAYVSRYGPPDSPRQREHRQRQLAAVAGPRFPVLARTLAARLADLPEDEGSPLIVDRLGPLSESEAASLGERAGVALPGCLLRKAEMSWEAPAEVLISKGLLTSSESLAAVLPLLTARVKADAVSDPQLAGAFEAVYRAFRRRRSLLLLNYQSQVRFEELPWIAAVKPWLGSERGQDDALEVLRQLGSLALRSFPYTVLPNKLTRELKALACEAGHRQPFVDELAADIFMGGFTANFVRAAKTGASLLGDTLYERYYGLPYDRVVGLDSESKSGPEQFSKLCRRLAGQPPARYQVAYSGKVIEQAQLLTTHNLALLLGPLGLRERLAGSFGAMARDCFDWICRRLARAETQPAPLRTIKDAAYAWRQMLVYLSLDDQETEGFLLWARQRLARADVALQRRLRPAVAGLEAVVAGESFDPEGRHDGSGGRRLLGWTVEPHWLLGS